MSQLLFYDTVIPPLITEISRGETIKEFELKNCIDNVAVYAPKVLRYVSPLRKPEKKVRREVLNGALFY